MSAKVIDFNAYKLSRAQQAVDEMVDQADAMDALANYDVERILARIRERHGKADD